MPLTWDCVEVRAESGTDTTVSDRNGSQASQTFGSR